MSILGDSAIFANDAATPSQWADTRRSAMLSPTRRLMLATLEDGLLCAGVLGRRTYPPRKHHSATSHASARDRVRKSSIRQREAIAWMLTPDGDGPFAFGVLCAEFGIDAGRLRALVDHHDGDHHHPDRHGGVRNGDHRHYGG